MLNEYYDVVDSLSEIEKILLEQPINKLNKELNPGIESLNLSSLGIPDFIDKCIKAINEFKETKKKVEKSASHIEEFVRNIEEARIFKDYDFESRKDPNSNVINIPTANEFMTYFDEHMNKTIVECVEKYNMIGDQFLKNIEETIIATQVGHYS